MSSAYFTIKMNDGIVATSYKAGDKFFIEDRDSRNGTFVNNQQIAGQTLLKNNDRIKICDFMCTFHDGTVVKPLPVELLPEEPDQEEGENSSTVEGAMQLDFIGISPWCVVLEAISILTPEPPRSAGSGASVPIARVPAVRPGTDGCGGW